MTSSLWSNAAAIAIAVVAVSYAWWKSAAFLPTPPAVSAPRPRYYIPNQERSHLEHVQEAFHRAGYELVTNENSTDDWHTMWTFHNPFWQREKSVDLPAKMQQLLSHQKVNHLPGASQFTSKIELAKHTERFDFIPKSFRLPTQYDEFQQFHQSDPTTSFVKKSIVHRGVRVVEPADPALREAGEKENLVQQYIKPYLIDSRMWDVGVYIAITSVNPLRVYYFDNLLVRACTEDFVEDLRKAPRDAYVVADDYLPPWGLPSFRPYYTWGMSTLNVLRAFFHHSKGVEFDEIFWEMRKDILELLGSYVPLLERHAGKFPHGQWSFYSLYRVDFILDRNLKPWITEVRSTHNSCALFEVLLQINQSPNLSSQHFADLATMFQRIAYSLLSLVGLTPGGMHHPTSTSLDMEILLHANDIDIGYSVCRACAETCDASEKCSLCRPCRTPTQSLHLKELISEQRSRLGFIPLYPLRNSSLPYLGDFFLPGDDHVLQQNFVWTKCAQDHTWC